jgi:hypothetical protein
VNVRAYATRHADVLLACAVAITALVLYVISLPPWYAAWDTGELQTVAAILGIAHPPACPAFVLLGWLFVHVVPFANAAWRVNFMCSCTIAISAAFLVPIARAFGTSRVVATLCALAFALAAIPWRDATRAEVQDVALVFRVLALFFALRYARDGSARDFFAMALATGLAGATHGISLLLLPGLAILIASRRTFSLRLLALGAAGVAVGLLPYAYLPLRSAWIVAHGLDPTVAIGLPPGLPFWNYDDPHTWPNFVRVITGADFDVHSGFAGFFALGDYPRFGTALVNHVKDTYGIPGLLLAAIGAGAFVVRRDARGIAIVLCALLPVPYTESYVELQDPDRYYLFTLWCSGIALGSGFELVLALFRLESRSVLRFAFWGGLVASFLTVATNRQQMFDQALDNTAPTYVADMKSITPDNAIVLAEWAYSTPLAYAAYVDNSLGNRIVVASSPQQYVSYIGTWLQTRPVYLVAFSDDVTMPGFRLDLIRQGPYFVYQITKAHT